MVLSTPIMRITVRPKFVSARRSAFLNVPFHWPITAPGSGGARPVSIGTQDTEKPRLLKLVKSDEKSCPCSVKLTVSIVGHLELSFISRVLMKPLSEDQMHPSWSRRDHTCAGENVTRCSPLSIRTITPALRTTTFTCQLNTFMIVA